MKILLFFILLLAIGCNGQEIVPRTEYLKLADSITVLHQQHKSMVIQIQLMHDSIAELKQHPLMTADQFIQLYKFGRLNKYYLICKRNPVQWKYYKGWSTRVFEQK